jgi:arabinose-5-phosphate isomerase
MQEHDAGPAQDAHAERMLHLARDVLDIEAEALAAVRARLDGAFVRACRLILAARGRVVVLGMGKSGHVGGKLAATLASTGTPAFFVHPGEASHGDLGMITREDVVIALSNSGETDEILLLVPLIRRMGVPLIAITGNPASTLAQEADVNLDGSVPREACPLGLAPTASTTAALALGDALAVALLEARGFSREDFSRSHPGGRLGRRLLVHIADVMAQGERVPRVPAGTPLPEALVEMTRKGLGFTAVVDGAGTLVGVYTDGDLRRTLAREGDIRTLAVDAVMTPQPTTVRADMLAAEAAEVMETRRINALPVVDEAGRLIGALNMHTLLAARVV